MIKTAAYQVLVILICIGLFGFIYSGLYDPIEKIVDNSSVSENPELQKTGEYQYTIWKFLPLFALVILGIYAIAVTQKG